MTCGAPLSAFAVVQLDVKMELPLTRSSNQDNARTPQADESDNDDDGSEEIVHGPGEDSTAAGASTASPEETPKKRSHKKRGKKVADDRAVFSWRRHDCIIVSAVSGFSIMPSLLHHRVGAQGRFKLREPPLQARWRSLWR